MTWTDRVADKLCIQIAAAFEDLKQLDPRAYLERGEEQKSGGLKSKAYDGVNVRASSARPIPVADDGGQKDPHDRNIDRQNRWYRQKIDMIVELLEELRKMEKARRRTPVDDDRARCENCSVPVEGEGNDRLRTGLCLPCYKAKRKELDK